MSGNGMDGGEGAMSSASNEESGAGRAGPSSPRSGRTLALTLGALGVVYGDIGTSPLYALRESALATGGAVPSHFAVLGATSLIFWSLILVVTIKYVSVILYADNDGEGGVLALATLAHRSSGLGRRTKAMIGAAAIIGLAMLIGDGMLTPAISVMSAIEGLKVTTSAFEPLVIPLSLAILIGLFAMQSRGTAKVGRLFGPVMVVWFVTLAGLGLAAIFRAPQILWALNPWHGLALFLAEPRAAFVALGAVVLAVTGCETLYADMGHFGRLPIRLAWFAIVLPALILNYFGQGAALLLHPERAAGAFYAVAPQWAHYPLVALATMAGIIASQAVITGVYSITRQAVQLGMLPRMEIHHTSATDEGQIYVPAMNRALAVGVVLIVLVFKSSNALAAAYGIAVTGIMVLSTLLVELVAIRQWGWSRWLAVPLFGAFAAIDLAFMSSNALKIFEGGWFPLAIAAGVYLLMDTWRVGRRAHMEAIRASSLPLNLFLERADKTPQRVSGTAVFMNVRTDLVPGPLLHSLKHYKVLHERVVLASVTVADTPFVRPEDRLEVNKLGKGFFEVKIRYGFFETADVPKALEGARPFGLALERDATTFFLGRETLVAGHQPGLSRWRVGLYMWLSSNAQSPASFFQLPPNRVVELGTQILI